MTPQTATRLLLAILVACGASSCRSTAVAYRFTPSPLEVLVQEAPGQAVLARVLVGIPGAERAGGSSSGHPELLVRVRIENKSASALRFDPSRAVLFGSDLAEFGAPYATPPGVLEVESGDASSTLLRFPFPRDGSLEAPLLTGVNLQFVLSRPPGDLEVSVTLERYEPEIVYDPGPGFTYGAGWYYGW